MDEFQQLHSVHSAAQENAKFTMVGPYPNSNALVLTPTDFQGLFKAEIIDPNWIVVKSRGYNGIYTLQFFYLCSVTDFPSGFRVENNGVVELIHRNDWVRVGDPAFPPSDPRFVVGVVYCQVLEVFSLACKQVWNGPTFEEDVSLHLHLIHFISLTLEIYSKYRSSLFALLMSVAFTS